MSADSIASPAAGAAPGRSRTVARLSACVAAALGAVVVWVVTSVLVGAQLEVAAGPVTWWMFAAAALVASLAGWAALAVLERVVRRARRWWLVLALVVLAASLLGPLGTPDLAPGTRVWLTVGHLVVAAVLVPGLLRTSRA